MTISIKQILKIVIPGVWLFLGLIVFIFRIIWIYEGPHWGNHDIFYYVLSVYEVLAGGIIQTSIGIASLYIFKIITTSRPVKEIIYITTSGIIFFLASGALILPIVEFYKNPDVMYYGFTTFTGFLYLSLVVGIILTVVGVVFLYMSKRNRIKS